MVRGFYEDLEKARKAEHLVCEVLSNLTDEYRFEEVGNQRKYYYKGDIKAIDDSWDCECFVEVKDDSRIADTGRVLCEYKVFYKDDCTFGKGNMQSNYDYYAVVSQQNKLIYMIDFEVLKENYKKGKHKIIEHSDQDTYCYLCTINQLCKWGAIMYFIWYREKNGHYYPTKVQQEKKY